MKPPDEAPLNPIDRDIAEAFAALDGTIPEAALDEMSARVLARLGDNEAGRIITVSRPPAGREVSGRIDPDDSGLHDIKALAGAARRRISEREASDVDEDSAVVLAAAHGGLRAVALPDPVRGRARGKSVGRAGERLRAETRSSASFWVLGSIATVAAVAAVAVFVFGIGRHHKAVLGRAGEEPAGEQGEAGAASPAPAAQPRGAVLVTPEEPALKVDDRAKSGPDDRRGRVHERRAERGRPVEPSQPSTEGGKVEASARRDEGEGQDQGASLDDVLDEVAGQKTRPARDSDEERRQKEAEAARQARRALDRGDVTRAMAEIDAPVQRCRELEQTRGTVTVKFVVAPTGEVSSAEPLGAHARSRTGGCVAGAVKQARFRAFDGPPMSFTYPFLLTGSP